MLLLYWIIGYICTLESGMFTVNGYIFSFNFKPLKTQNTIQTLSDFFGLMNATLSVKFLLREGFCPPPFFHGRVFVLPRFFHGRVFVRPRLFMGGFSSGPYKTDGRVFIREGFCPAFQLHTSFFIENIQS